MEEKQERGGGGFGMSGSLPVDDDGSAHLNQTDLDFITRKWTLPFI